MIYFVGGNSVLKDTKRDFYEAVNYGREIEFSYNGKHYFESRDSDHDWYIYCEETKEKQQFPSANKLLLKAMLEGKNINDIWEDINIECIL